MGVQVVKAGKVCRVGSGEDVVAVVSLKNDRPPLTSPTFERTGVARAVTAVPPSTKQIP